MICLWGLCVFYFSPRLFALLVGPECIPAKFFLLIFIFLQIIFWFYIFFHLAIIGFSCAIRNKKKNTLYKQITGAKPFPSVALLYTTCNDFQENAALTHVSQDYPCYHLFILDDSTDFFYQQRVDEFKKNHADKVTVIRRNNRRGFKAGNINHAMRQISKEYEYFNVSDADTLLPDYFIRDLLPYVVDPRVAFAQAHLKSNQKTTSSFARYFAINTDIHFKCYAVTKNVYGFVMWYGHAALMRRDVFDLLGGLPEIATEDLAYSMKAREHGFEGVFCDHVVCLEDFPAAYCQYRRRNEKWIRGTAECLSRFYPGFLKAKNVPWFEKADVLASAGTLLFSLPFVLFLILGGIILPVFYHHFQFAGPMFKMPIGYDRISLEMASHIQSNLFWSWDLFVLLLGTIFAPLIPVFIDYWRNPKQIMRYLAIYTFCFFSLQLVSAIHCVVAFLTRTAVFPVTGAKDQPVETNLECGPRKVWFLRSHANLPQILFAEFCIGILCVFICIRTQTLWFTPVAGGLILSPGLFYWNLNPRFMRPAICLPFAMVIGIIYFIVQGLTR